jgi:hypothetical protein
MKRWPFALTVTAASLLGCTSLVGVEEFSKVDEEPVAGALDGSSADDGRSDSSLATDAVGTDTGTVVDAKTTTDTSAAADTRVPADTSAVADTWVTTDTGAVADTKVTMDTAGAPDTTPVDADPSCPGVQLISTAAGPTGLALGPSEVLWGRNCGAAEGCAKAGCTGSPTRLTSIPITCATGIAATSNTVFVVDNLSRMYSCTLPGCTSPKSLPFPESGPGYANFRVMSAGGAGAFVIDAGATTTYLAKFPSSGEASCRLGRIPSADVLGIAMVGTRVFVTHGTAPNLALGSFPSNCSGAADGPQPFILPREGLSSLVARVNTLYWTEKSSIVQCDYPPSCTPSTFVSGLDSHPRALAVDSASLYWLTASGIYKCPITGCGAAPTRLSCEGCASDYGVGGRIAGLAVDFSHVYMSCPSTNRVIRVAK